ncbi:hypothetical protein HPB47_009697 [Ixodes persulcatus]|uniref:Uncharacterized protein n=1 Tax=Ixodes persulcatus TaxID=34615 RepID=A0AC60P162_IXOPE|nr:hypothetical protein HPB47_009697 [Ixodes persulcatus]
MADTDASDTKTANSKGSRVQWTEGETRALFQRNAGVYDRMVLLLGRLDIMRSRMQAAALLSQISDFSYQPPYVNDTMKVICEDAGAMDSEDSPSLGQPRLKLAEKQLEFMNGLLDEQRALRLCWESSRSAELSFRERQLSLLQLMHDVLVLMQEKPKEK